MADGVCAEEVRDVLLAFTKSNREVVPTTNPKEEHKKKRWCNNCISSLFSIYLLLIAVVFRIIELLNLLICGL